MEDIRRELCESYPGYIADYTFSWTILGKNVFNKFCRSNMTLLESSLQELTNQFSQVSVNILIWEDLPNQVLGKN